MENIIKYRNLVSKIAHKYSKYGNYEDLFQVGMIGLIKAVDKYKSKNNTKFSTYAYIWIKGEIIEYIRNDRNIKLSKEIISLNKEINMCKEILTNKLGKIPSVEEIAYFLDKDVNDINDALTANELILSCDYMVDDEISLYDTLPYVEKMYNEEILDLHSAIDELEVDEKNIIKMRYFEDMTQSEVSKILGTNQVNISRKEEKILTKLNKKLVV